MNKLVKHIINLFRRNIFLLLLTTLPCLILNANNESKDKISFTLNIRGIYKSDLTLKKFNGSYFKDDIATFKNATDFARLEVPISQLPGSFILRFDYMQKPGDRPYPVEIPLFLNKSDIEWNINPLYNTADSLIIINDRENSSYRDFMLQNQAKRKTSQCLSKFFQHMIKLIANTIKTQLKNFVTVKQNTTTGWIK